VRRLCDERALALRCVSVSRTRTEIAVAIWSAITFGSLLAAIMVSPPVRDALALDGDVDKIPWLWTGTFAVFLVVAPIWGKAVTRDPRRVVPRAFHLFAGCALVFFALMRAGIAPLATGYTFYIWSSVLNMLLVSAFWSLLADLFDHEIAKKLYGPISAGGTIGAFAGPALTKLSLQHVDFEVMFVYIAFFLELAVVGVYQVKRHGRTLLADPSREHPLPPGAFQGLQKVARDRYLAAIAGYVLCTSIAATFVYLAQADIVKAELGDREARTDWFATIALWTQGITFVAQLLLARPLLGLVGPGIVMCLLPLVQSVGLLALELSPSLTTLALVAVLGRAATHGLTRPARELLFTVVSRADKYRAKNVIDTLVLRFGDFGAAWLRTGLVAISAGAALLTAAIVPLALGWLALALVLGAGFRRRATAKESS
jgi:ATP:ADP antiporter, AAA family